MAIVYCYNKSRNVTYVYESVSYWDKEKKQPRSSRKLIGKLDPDTGKVVPTAKRNRSDYTMNAQNSPDNSVTTDYKVLYENCLSELTDLRLQLDALKAQNRLLSKAVSDARKALDTAAGGAR